MKYLLFIFLVAIYTSFIYFVIFILSRRLKKVKHNKSKNVTNPPIWENTQNEIIAEGIFNKIISKGLKNFLLSDFSTNNKLLYEDLRIPENAYKKISIILVDILQYLHLPPFVKLQIEYVNKSQSETQTAGNFHSESNKKTILIKIKKEYSPVNILAILCHECTHYFMEYNNLNLADTKLNEIQTDIIAVMIGFNEILIEGYKEIINESYIDYNKIQHTSNKIGYITSCECQEVKNYLNYKRVLLVKEQYNQDKVIELTRKLNKLYETALFLNEQIQNLDFTNIHFTSEEISKQIQSELYNYECRNTNVYITKIKNILDSKKDIEDLNYGTLIAEDLCSDLVKWLTLFQSN